MITVKLSIVSIGCIARDAGTQVVAIYNAAVRLGIAAEQQVDGVTYFAREHVEALKAEAQRKPESKK